EDRRGDRAGHAVAGPSQPAGGPAPRRAADAARGAGRGLAEAGGRGDRLRRPGRRARQPDRAERGPRGGQSLRTRQDAGRRLLRLPARPDLSLTTGDVTWPATAV